MNNYDFYISLHNYIVFSLLNLRKGVFWGVGLGGGQISQIAADIMKNLLQVIMSLKMRGNLVTYIWRVYVTNTVKGQ